MTKFLAICVLIVPFILMLNGLVLGLILPSVGSALFELAGKSLRMIWHNFWFCWPLTVPVTVFAIMMDVAPAMSRS